MAFKESKADFSTKNKFTDELACFVSHEAGFVTAEGNEAASANIDEMAEKAVIASRSKDLVEVKKEKKTQKELRKEIASEKKEIKAQTKQLEERQKLLSENRAELNRMIEENKVNPSNQSKAAIEEKRAKVKEQERFIEHQDKRIESNRTELRQSRDKKKEHKKSEGKAKKKATSKLSVANMLRAKKDLSNDLAGKGRDSGDAFSDGKSGLVGTLLDVINPMTYLKALIAKIGAAIAPAVTIFLVLICVIVIIVAALFDVMAPIAAVGDAISNFISIFTDDHVFTNAPLSADRIDEIIADSGCDETQETVLRFALSKVSYPYSQAHRTDGAHFDCSSLAYYAWKEAGVDISFGSGYPPSAAEGARMLNNAGKTVASEDAGSFSLKPGDLIYYGGSDNGRYKGIYHVAIYVGNGCAVEALNTEYGVVYQTVRTNKAIMVCRPNR